MLFHHGRALFLDSFVARINGNCYWWCHTIFVDQTEVDIYAFPDNHAYQLLHTTYRSSA